MTAVSENHTNTVVHDHRQSLTEVRDLTPFVRREI
jgi:anti-sigma regulatory factor (Ser/Thr protein kinase)